MTTSHLSFIIFLTFALAAAVVNRGKCKPTCLNNGGCTDVTADPFNCSSYYFCIECEPMDFPVACDKSGDVFDNINFDPKVPCKTPAPSDPPCIPSCIKDCTFTCPLHVLKSISDPFDCHKYTICNEGIPAVSQTCPTEKPYFDGTMCGIDPDDCCTPGCEAFCTQAGVIVADPVDCHKYYICTSVGTPTEANHHECPPEEVFDVALGGCSSASSCKVLCPTYQQPNTTPEASTTLSGTTDPSTTPPVTTDPYITPSVTPNPSITPSATPDPSITPSATPVPSITPSATPDPSITPSATPVPSITPSVTPVPSISPTATPDPSTTPSGTPSTIPDSSSTSTTTPAPTSECVDSLICPSEGNFAMCVTCQQNYFLCREAGMQALIGACTGELLFNPNPDFPFCIHAYDCPYYPVSWYEYILSLFTPTH